VLRLKAVAPLRLDNEEIQRRKRRYDRIAGPGIRVTLVNLEGADAPVRLDNAADIAASEWLTAAEIGRTDPREFDAVMPDCVLDPAVGTLPDAPVPVLGMLRLSAGHLISLGLRFDAVTRNQAIAEELERKLTGYGLAAGLGQVHVLDADFCLISDDDGWAASIAAARAATAAAGAGALLNGCSAVDVTSGTDGPAPVVDPAALALSVLGVSAGAGLVTAAALASACARAGAAAPPEVG
jgi:Asp/Glu/hydantoin racemase